MSLEKRIERLEKIVLPPIHEKYPEDQPQQNEDCGQPMCRQSAPNALQSRISELERKVLELKTLQKALPVELPPKADDALWRLLVDNKVI